MPSNIIIVIVNQTRSMIQRSFLCMHREKRAEMREQKKRKAQKKKERLQVCCFVSLVFLMHLREKILLVGTIVIKFSFYIGS